jgi:hypothetical protein
MKNKIRTIKWRDSRMYIQQEVNDGVWSVCEITSIGFVIHEDKDKIVLAGDFVGEDVRRVIVIPKENIIR